MNPFNIKYSLKNIPLPSRQQYQRLLVDKIEQFITNLRWTKYHKNSNNDNSKETYKFKSTNPPPPDKELTDFEEDLYKLAKEIEFRPVRNEFQNNLSEQIKKIHASKDIIVKGDKSRNLYSIPVQEYNKLLTDNITSEYKKTNSNQVMKINKEAAILAKKIELDDRVDQYIESNAFVTVKDHKPNFPDRIQCRLINPAKSNIGKISKSILEKTVIKIKSNLNFNQWKNSDEVINWFKNLQNKENMSFIKFDIVSFYPSISEELFNNAINWAKQFYKFNKLEMEIIQNARKSVLFYENNPWVKKDGKDFDITMGSYDGAEACELVGLYILDKIKTIIDPKNVGLYRDDGLAAIPGSGPAVERTRKQVCEIFHKLGLNVTTEANLTQTDFLDIYFNLRNNTFKPFRKMNDKPVYIHTNSNHPKVIKRNLPQMISDRIAKLSSSKQIYDSEIETYKEALNSAGYKQSIQYKTTQKPKKNRTRKVLWFNPPYSETVKTNVGAKFLTLVDKHFKNKPLGSIFNRNTVKVSYSCLPNIESIISGHNRKILLQEQNKSNQIPKTCNCNGGPQSCPLQANCLQESIIYEAKVESNNTESIYIGQAGNAFKERYNNHTSTFRNKKYENSTTLSKHIWTLKDLNQNYSIKWHQKKQASTYTKESRKCNLCNLEKTLILYSTEPNLLNKRGELMNKCRHRNKHLLSKLK